MLPPLPQLGQKPLIRHVSFSPPRCKSDTTAELDQIGPFAKAYVEAFEIPLPVLAVACLRLYLLRSVYSSGLIGARPPCARLTQITRRLCLLEYLIVSCCPCNNYGPRLVMGL